MRQKCLMLGAGHSRPKRRVIAETSAPEHETKWIRLDMNSDAKPDILFDLAQLETGGSIPARDFDEIHAYEVLEHFGSQGNYAGLFSTFRAFWQALKPGGLLMGTCPSLQSPWLWVEPGHTRVIAEGTLSFLTKDHYNQLGESSCSDYRVHVDPYWWELEYSKVEGDNYVFALRKSQ